MTSIFPENNQSQLHANFRFRYLALLKSLSMTRCLHEKIKAQLRIIFRFRYNFAEIFIYEEVFSRNF